MLAAAALLGVVAYGVWSALDELLGRSLPAQVVSVGAGARARRGRRTRRCCCAAGCPEARQIVDLLRRAGCAAAARNLYGRAMADQSHIRNFSIIAHIDHGKSTLADRILEMTHTVDPRAMRAQLLDSMDLERERGITIKAQAVRVSLHGARRRDLPAPPDRHARATSTSPTRCRARWPRARARCSWSTPRRASRRRRVANTYLAIDGGLELIPCLNKIDLPGAEPERVAREIAELIGEPADEVQRISAKTGEGVDDVLEEIVARVPPPAGDPDAPPRALIFDSEFDQYRGVIAYIRVVDGTFRKGEAIRAMAAGTEAEIDDIGFFTPRQTPADELGAGEVGYLITGIKDVTQLRVGDTLTTKARGADRRRCPATATSSRWSSAACSRSTPTPTPTCATRSRS